MLSSRAHVVPGMPIPPCINKMNPLLDSIAAAFWRQCQGRSRSTFACNAPTAKRQAPTDSVFCGPNAITVEFLPDVARLAASGPDDGGVVASLSRLRYPRTDAAMDSALNPGLKFALSSNKAYGNSHRADQDWEVRYGGKGASHYGFEFRMYVVRPKARPGAAPAPGALLIRLREEVFAAVKAGVSLEGLVLPTDICNAVAPQQQDSDALPAAVYQPQAADEEAVLRRLAEQSGLPSRERAAARHCGSPRSRPAAAAVKAARARAPTKRPRAVVEQPQATACAAGGATMPGIFGCPAAAAAAAAAVAAAAAARPLMPVASMDAEDTDEDVPEASPARRARHGASPASAASAPVTVAADTSAWPRHCSGFLPASELLAGALLYPELGDDWGGADGLVPRPVGLTAAEAQFQQDVLLGLDSPPLGDDDRLFALEGINFDDFLQ